MSKPQLDIGSFFEHSDCALLICANDPYSTIIEANEAFYAMVGYSPEEMLTQHQNRFANLVIDDLGEILRKVGNSVSANNTLDYEYRIRKKSGEVMWIHDIATFDPSQNRFSVVIMDITYRQNALEAIQKTAHGDALSSWLSSLIDNIPSAIAIYDAQQQVVANKLFKSIAQRCYDDTALTEAQRQQFFDLLASSAAMKSELSVTQLVLADRVYRVRQRLLTHSRSEQQYLMLVFDDITSLKEKEQKLTKAIDARNQFLAVVSHELRTPIASMLGLMEMLDKYLEDPAAKLLLDNAKLSADRLKLHVNDILDFSKIEAGQLQIDATRGNVYAECGPILRGYEQVARNKGLNFVVDWVVSPYLFMTLDWLRIHQIINNIVSNALKFTDNGYLHIAVDCQAEQLFIKVTDSGCGMDAEQQANLFKPFVQGDKTISRRYGGTGLGLSIVKNLLDILAGTIEVVSEPGQGTSVTVTIPTQAQPWSGQVSGSFDSDCRDIKAWLSCWKVGNRRFWQSPSMIRRDPQFNNLYPDLIYRELVEHSKYSLTPPPAQTAVHFSVLAVDDNEINRLMMKVQFESLGASAVIVASGKEAYSQLCASLQCPTKPKFDVVVTDLHMPEMNGFELTELIKQHPGLAEIPVLGCTADNSKHVVEQAQQYGMAEVIFKPYQLEKLHRSILKRLQQRGAVRPTTIPIHLDI
ncbi:hybrid sensor histidine kinase/response regulator [Ferrimonas senticii]|uniref:PAS domain-containing hybrid sensor histidine kinase/response regulator n=1 Tax=Ferrimonas senticii TaxID=394566 RepID=UPI00041953AE|nr:hybrid sensor histidine kinase/response regulator [Ferrimonas senticii]